MEHTLFVFAFIGLIFLLKTTKNLLKWLYQNFFRPSKNLKLHYGSWALVTGATDGIGKAIAFQLAHSGFNLVLVSRNTQKLERVSREIKNEVRHNGIMIKIVTFDFTEGDMTDGVCRIEKAIQGLDVGVLVNSAGATYGDAMYFDEVGEGVWRNVVRVNVEGTTWVTKVVMKGMLERGRGAVVNVGSGASCALPSFPLYTVYSASKAYIDQFSKCLYIEYKKKGIDVQCQIPLYVDTKMASIGRSSFFVPSPDTYARVSLQWIGYESRCTPYWPHSVLWSLLSTLPHSALDCWRLNHSLNIRKKSQLKPTNKFFGRLHMVLATCYALGAPY